MESIKAVKYITPPADDFEKNYKRIREKENRWLSDEMVQALPILPSSHPHYREWKKRANSLKRILKILKKSGEISKLLEIGCGNGWFANQLLAVASEIDALDVGKEELEQAARCFQNKQIHFFCCNDLSLIEDKKYDCIIFNASIQYFHITNDFWTILFHKLSATGRIFVLDSPIYNESQLDSARKSTNNYFESIKESVAISYYKHVSWDMLPNYKIEYNPSKIGKFLNLNQSPFPIIQITKDWKT